MSGAELFLRPHRGLILVREDKLSSVLDSGLHAPDDSSRVPWTGIILERGPWAAEDLSIGRRIFYRPHGSYYVGREDRTGLPVRMMAGDRVLGFLDPLSAFDLPSAEWPKSIVAAPGMLLVRRVENPLARGLIVYPDGYRVHVRSHEADIVAIGSGVEGFVVGSRVFLAQAAGEELRFGDREEICLVSLPPDQVLADVLIPEALEVEGERPDLDPDLPPPPDRPLDFDEGDSRGLR